MALKRESALRTRRWTRVEYERLIDVGVFQPDERLELLDGALVIREPQSSRHAAAIRKVLAALRTTLGDAWRSQQDAFYGSPAWREGPRESIVSRIESHLSTVVWLSPESIDDLRRSNASVED